LYGLYRFCKGLPDLLSSDPSLGFSLIRALLPSTMRAPFQQEGGMSRSAKPIAVPCFSGFRPTSAVQSRAKRSNRKTDTSPEVLLRRVVWSLGLRYRKNVAGLPGKPDLVFASVQVAVFCDGDFWHGRDWPRLRKKLERGSNAAYWSAKIARNVQRDRANQKLLEKQGWLVLRLWETNIKRDPIGAAKKIQRAVARRAGRRGLD
jgi:DNA mismatch endonuclease (patch repair protein)